MAHDMEGITLKDTKRFIPPIQEAKVLKVYDGDTVTIGTYLYGDLYRFSVRLRGIDAPELREAGDRAIQARNLLADLIYNKMVTLKNVGYDKYGRILADIYTTENENVSALLLQSGFVDQY